MLKTGMNENEQENLKINRPLKTQSYFEAHILRIKTFTGRSNTNNNHQE